MSGMDAIRDLLETTQTIAVVGCSAKPARDSHRVAAYLQRAGYRIIPVNPGTMRFWASRCIPISPRSRLT